MWFILFFYILLYQYIINSEKKIEEYVKNNLRAPPILLVKKWGKNLSAEEIQTVNDRIKWRGQLGKPPGIFFGNFFFKKKCLGPDSGALNNTKKWKATTPHSFKSPYICQGDIGYFSFKNKKYGAFFCGVQTFSRKVFAVPIPNVSTPSLIKAIEQMVKVIMFGQISDELRLIKNPCLAKRIQNYTHPTFWWGVGFEK